MIPICSLGGELQDPRAVRSGAQEHSVVLSQTLALFLTSFESVGMLLKLRSLISGSVKWVDLVLVRNMWEPELQYCVIVVACHVSYSITFLSVESLRVSHLALTVNTLTLCSTLGYSAQYNHFERKFMSIFFRSGKNTAEGVHINKTNHFFIFDAFGMPHQLYDLINSRAELKYIQTDTKRWPGFHTYFLKNDLAL